MNRRAGARAAVQDSAITLPKERLLPIGKSKLYCREIGNGPTILMLHGSPFDHSYLLPEMDRFANSYHLVYYDQRGRGRSAAGWSPEDVSWATDLTDLESVRQQLQLDPTILLGHSQAGLLALEYALRYPQRVSRLILLNPAPASSEEWARVGKDWNERYPARAQELEAVYASATYAEGDPDAEEAGNRIWFRHAFAREKDLTTILARFRCRSKADVLRWRAIFHRLMADTLLAPGYNLFPRVEALRVPTLLVSGDHDFVPPWQRAAERLARALPDAHLAMITDCGHFPYLERPRELRDIFAAFLRTP